MAVGQRTRRLVIEATMDNRGVVTGAKKVETSTEKMGKSVSNTGKAVRTAMGVVAAGAVVAFGKEMANHVAVMESVERRTDQVFGAMAKDIRAWADDNAEAFGMSQNGVLNLASAFGDLLIPMGFTRQETAKLTKETLEAANALSEWTGGQIDTATAAEAVQKAMLGEREMLKSLGISILEADVKQRLFEKGQQDLTGTALQQAKALATQELIFEKSADALQAYAEGGESALKANKELASQVAELKDELGTRLQPVLAAAVSGVSDFAEGINVIIDWFDELPAAAKIAAGAITGLIAVMTIAKGHPVLAGLALVAGAIAFIGNQAKEAEEELDDFIQRLEDLEGKVDVEFIRDMLPPEVVNRFQELGVGVGELADRFNNGTLFGDAFRDSLAEQANQLGLYAGVVVAELDPALADLEKRYWAARIAAEAAAGDVELAAEAMELQEKAARRAAQANDKKYTPSVEDLTDANQDALDVVEELTDAILSQADPFFAAVDAADDYEKALADAIDTQGIDREETFELAKAKARARIEFEKFERTAGSYEAAMGLMQDATGKTRKEIEDLINEGETLDGSTWGAVATVKVDATSLELLEATRKRLQDLTTRGIKVDLHGMKIASSADIEHAVNRALVSFVRRGRIVNIFD